MGDADTQFSRITFNFQGTYLECERGVYSCADRPQKEASIACKLISEALNLRKKYVFTKLREDWIPAPEVDTNTQVLFCWFGLVWFDLVWFGLVWFGLVWFGLVWFGLVWFGLVWFGLVWFGLVW